MRSTTLLALLVAASSTPSVLSSPLVNYVGNSPTSSVKSAAPTKPTAMSRNKKKVVFPSGGGVKGTTSTYGTIETGGSSTTNTSLGPAITGLNYHDSQKQYSPPGQGASSILMGADSTDTALSPTDTSDACLFDDMREEQYDSESTSSVTSALDTLPTGTYGNQKQYVPPAGGDNSITTDTMMPTDTMASSPTTSSLVSYAKRQAGATISPIASPNTLSTSTITGGPLDGYNQRQQVQTGATISPTASPTTLSTSTITGAPLGGYNQRQQVQTGATISPTASPTTLSTSTITGAPLGGYSQRQQVQTGATTTNTAFLPAESDFMMDIVLPDSKTVSAEVSEFTGAGESKKVVIKKLGCGGKSGSRKQKVNPSPQGDVTGTATGTFDLGSPTSLALQENAYVPPVGATSTGSLLGYDSRATTLTVVDTMTATMTGADTLVATTATMLG